MQEDEEEAGRHDGTESHEGDEPGNKAASETQALDEGNTVPIGTVVSFGARRAAGDQADENGVEEAVGDSAAVRQVFGNYRNAADIDAQFQQAVVSTRAMETQRLPMNEACWASASACFAIGAALSASPDALTSFCKKHSISCTSRTCENPFLPPVKAVYRAAQVDLNDKDASRIARGLKELMRRGVEPARAHDFLKANGGIDGCLRMARAERGTGSVERPNAKKASEPTATVPRTEALSPIERALIEAIRARGAGRFTCNVHCDRNGLKTFTVENCDRGDSIANRDEAGTENLISAA